MIDVEVVDNFLTTEEHTRIADIMKSAPDFWRLSKVNHYDDDVYMTHMFYEHQKMSQSNYLPELNPLLRKIDPTILIRAKGNIYISSSEENKEHERHTDYPFSHLAAVYTINTCNGYTLIGDEKQSQKVPSVANRIVFFDGSLPHASTNCTDERYRMNINLNMLRLDGTNKDS